MNNNPPYSNLYKGYFDVHDPYTEHLEEIYERPVPIPIYTADDLFNNHQLENIDLHIFRYFHFVAARSFELDTLKTMYIAYRYIKENLKRQMQVYFDLINAPGEDRPVYSFKTEVGCLFENECYQSAMSADVKTALLASEKDIKHALDTFYKVIREVHFNYKKALLDFQSNLEEDRKMTILSMY